jgi:putative oxidoreductase
MASKRATSTSWLMDLGLFIIRVMLAAVFMFHGSQKLFGLFDGPGLGGTAAFMEQFNLPAPHVSAFLAGCAEFFGGLALLLGFTRIAAVPLAFTMMVAVTVVHPGAFGGNNGMEFPLTLAMVLVGLLLMGGGRLSVARLIMHWWRTRRKPKPAQPAEAAAG